MAYRVPHTAPSRRGPRRYRSAGGRAFRPWAGRRLPDPPAAIAPIAPEGRRREPIELDADELDLIVESIDEVIKAKRPRVADASVARWTNAIARTLELLAPRVLAAVDYPSTHVERVAVRIGLRKAAGDVPADVIAEVDRAIERMLADLYDEVGEDGWTEGNRLLAIAADYGARERFAPELRQAIGAQVTKIGETTRDEIRRMVALGIERGYSQDQMRDGVGRDSFGGLRTLFDRSRAEMIGRTETAHAYNLGALDRYSLSGLVEEVNVFDGRDCGWTTHTDPDPANGKRVPIEEARNHPSSHPNCQRSFGPVVAGAPPSGSPGAQDVRPPKVDPTP